MCITTCLSIHVHLVVGGQCNLDTVVGGQCMCITTCLSIHVHLNLDTVVGGQCIYI